MQPEMQKLLIDHQFKIYNGQQSQCNEITDGNSNLQSLDTYNLK